MNPRATLDVSGLPPPAFDTRAPVWWGNTLFMVIETTTLSLLVMSYFYLWQNFPQWPPPRGDAAPALERPVPDLWAGTLNAILLAASCVAMVWVDRAARRKSALPVRVGLILLGLVGVGATVLRLFEFPALKFRWDDNAYASTVWAILVLHLSYVVAATLEAGVLTFWVFRYGLDTKKAVDVTLTAVYWYWMAGTWVVLYAVVYWAPRLV